VISNFERLFNKSIQESNIQVFLFDFADLKIFRLFLKKIKLSIDEISIYDSSTLDFMKKEDFEQIKP
jgi:hypothetical protein